MSDLFEKEKPYKLPWYIRFIRFTIGPIYHAIDDRIAPLSKRWYSSKSNLTGAINKCLRYEANELEKYLGYVENDAQVPAAFHGGSRYGFGYSGDFPFYGITEAYEEINRLVATHKELESGKGKRSNFRWWRAEKQIKEMDNITRKLDLRLEGIAAKQAQT